MDKIVYSKFSNERSPEFAIQTNIIKQDDNQYRVMKVAMSEEAKKHIQKMLLWKEKLTDLFKGTILEPCHCKIEDDKAIFKYIRGKTLEQILDEYLMRGEFEFIFELIERYFSLCRCCAKKSFIKTDELKKIFGNVEFSEDTKCCSVSNVDMIFSNIIESNGKWYLIDYEWCFDFPVPLEYILYRAIHYYVNTKEEREILIKKGIFDLLEEKERYLSQFERMEKNFQKYIEGDVVSCSALYEKMGARTHNVQYLIEVSPSDYKGRNLEIYIDKGEGFSQDTMILLDAEKLENDEYRLIVPVDDKVKQVRIDPANYRCIVRLLEMTGHYENEINNPLYSFMNHNGLETEEHEYVFDTADPWFWLNISDRSIKWIEMRYRLKPIGDDAAVSMEILYKKQQQTYAMYAREVDSNYHHEQDLEAMRNRMIDVEKKLEDVQQLYNQTLSELNAIKKSASWKITKPIRNIRKGLIK